MTLYLMRIVRVCEVLSVSPNVAVAVAVPLVKVDPVSGATVTLVVCSRVLHLGVLVLVPLPVLLPPGGSVRSTVIIVAGSVGEHLYLIRTLTFPVLLLSRAGPVM